MNESGASEPSEGMVLVAIGHLEQHRYPWRDIAEVIHFVVHIM